MPTSERNRFAGKREWIESLRTKDRVEAKRLIPAYVQAFDRAMMDARAPERRGKPLERAVEASPVPGNQSMSRRHDRLCKLLLPSSRSSKGMSEGRRLKSLQHLSDRAILRHWCGM
ncbi:MULTISPECIES: DUF6538 domain-containing protein [unclassified Sphingomonas]|uniref:DUF6538 domain-containing protein n=1 Tax=unclassified Sphingomonas TaxID=196159 RepID=UPI0038685402